MIRTNKSQIILEIEKLECEGELNQQNVEFINSKLETGRYDFRLLFIEHGCPYFSYYFEIINTADFPVSKCRSKNTFEVYQKNRLTHSKHEPILIVALKDIISTLKNINGDKKRARKLWRALSTLIGSGLSPLAVKPNEPSLYNQNIVIEQINQSVKDNGSAGLPGADGFTPSLPRKEHRIPRMRSQAPTNIQDLGHVPKQFYRPTTKIEGTTRDDHQCPAKKLDMKKEFKNFMQKMSKEGYELECSQERFNNLSTNPQTGSPDEKSLIEAKGGLQGEAQGMYTNIRRPSNKDVDLDFEIDSSKGYTHVDFKTPIDFQDLADEKGIDVQNFPSLETVAYNMGKKLYSQKEAFCGLNDGPKNPENVLHVVNLDLIRDSNQKKNMIDQVLKGVEDTNNDTSDIQFLNYL